MLCTLACIFHSASALCSVEATNHQPLYLCRRPSALPPAVTEATDYNTRVVQLQKLKLKALREICEDLGISSNGKKQVLAERIAPLLDPDYKPAGDTHHYLLIDHSFATFGQHKVRNAQLRYQGCCHTPRAPLF